MVNLWNHSFVCASYRNVECRPARVIPFPVMGDGRVLPPCRSSIERLQGFDLSTTASGLFSKQSPSNLLHHESNRQNNKPTLKAAGVGNFGVNINNFLCSVRKKCHNIHRQLLVSDVVWECRQISVLSHHASVFRISKNPIAPVLFAQSVTLSVLCPNSPVYAMLLSDKWCWYELLSRSYLLQIYNLKPDL